MVWYVRDGGGASVDYGCMDAVCYHFGGPLEEADIEDVNGHRCVVCPWHRYPISLQSGESMLRERGGVAAQTKGVKQRVHEVRVEGDDVSVRLRVDDNEEVASDHYANMGLYRVAQQRSTARVRLHSERNARRDETRSRRKGCMLESEYKEYVLTARKQVAPDVCTLTFALPARDALLACPPGMHVRVRANVAMSASSSASSTSTTMERDYTPVAERRGEFTLLVKRYERGPMSTHLHAMSVGDSVSMRGPLGHWQYEANEYDTLCMVCNGTGVTPMISVMRVIAEHASSDKCRAHLLYQCRSERDILLRTELEQLVDAFPSKLSMQIVLSRAEESASRQHWRGRLDATMLRKWLSACGLKPNYQLPHFILMCGTDQFCEMVEGALVGDGYSRKNMQML